MLRKAFCYITLLLANVVLLAHSAVLHHYHEDARICFILHCKDSNEAHRHDYHDSETHHHEGNYNPDICYIDDDYTTAQHILKATCKTPHDLHEDCACEHTLIKFVWHALSLENFAENTKISVGFAPYSQSYHLDYIVESLGLRAPPTQLRVMS